MIISDVKNSGFVAISVEDIAKVKGFKKALGYINTQKNKKMKGLSGRAK